MESCHTCPHCSPASRGASLPFTITRSTRQGDTIKMNKMSSTHYKCLIISSALLLLTVLTLITYTTTAASIDQNNSIITHKQRHPSRSPLQSREASQPLPKKPQLKIEPRTLVVLDTYFPEDNLPKVDFPCPLDLCVTRKPSAPDRFTKSLAPAKWNYIKQKVKYSWFKNGEPLARENGNTVSTFYNNSVLVLYQIGESDEGRYKCQIDYSDVRVDAEMLDSFDFCEALEFEVQIRRTLIDQAPIIINPPMDKIVYPGESVEWQCNRTDTLSTTSIWWFRGCPFKDSACSRKLDAAIAHSMRVKNEGPLSPFIIESSFNQASLTINNVTENETGSYGCVARNDLGVDIRRARLQLYEQLLQDFDAKTLELRQRNQANSIEWIWLAIGMAAFCIPSLLITGCVYLFKRSVLREKKQSAALIQTVSGKDTDSDDANTRRRLPNMEVADIYNTGKCYDGFITGHLHQPTGHLMTQSVCSKLLDKTTPSISSANSAQSDEASHLWGKSSGDSNRTPYTPASSTTATTVPMYDHPPSTGTLRQGGLFVHGACINNPTYGFLRPENDVTEWSFPRSNLRRLDKIGEGQFGQVWRYIARFEDGFEKIVAVKQLRDRLGCGDRERLDLIAEIDIMKSIKNHPNVIKLFSSVIDEGPILLIMEYAEKGKLQTYLRDCRQPRKCTFFAERKSKPSITSKELIKFTYHIAKGMEYVASKGIVHRDLASRNILVSDDLVCKVADFGFARRVNDDCAYERTSTMPEPVKWMAPEVLIGNRFTFKSDVFSLGILMWEIVTLGATPYDELTTEGVYKKVTTGGRLERPPHCKDEFFDLMAQCWSHDPVLRPTFKEVCTKLEKLLISENDYIELDQYPEHAYYNIRNTVEKEVVNLDT